jgi:hypothetical protein
MNSKTNKKKNRNYIFISKWSTTYILQANNIKEKAKKAETYQSKLQTLKSPRIAPIRPWKILS